MLTNRKYSGRKPLVVVMALLSLMIMLPLVGCKTDVNPSTPQQELSSGENPGGKVSTGNIVLESIPKTSEVQVISKPITINTQEVTDGVTSVFGGATSTTIDPFMMGQYEVTQQLYQAVMGSNPSHFQGEKLPDEGETQELRPVENIRFLDAIVFCNELTKKVMGEQECVYYSDESLMAVFTSSDSYNKPSMNPQKKGYRLPTAAEWELAARGGNPDAPAWNYTFAGSNDKDAVAWDGQNTDWAGKTHQVGMKDPNTLGLYDMNGNVGEIVWYATGWTHIRLGGGIHNTISSVCFHAKIDEPKNVSTGCGLRLVRTVE